MMRDVEMEWRTSRRDTAPPVDTLAPIPRRVQTRRVTHSGHTSFSNDSLLLRISPCITPKIIDTKAQIILKDDEQ